MSFLAAAAALVALLLGAASTASAQVFDPGSTFGPFVPQAELPPLGPAEIDGDTALIPASGLVYVFERTPVTDTWAQIAVLTPSDGAPQFGRAVAIDGDTAIVGAEGAAYVFARTPAWHQVARIAPADAGGRFFGISVDVDGDYVIVGASGSQPANISGAAYVFRRAGDETNWQEVAQLHPPTAGRFAFGAARLSGATAIVVSAPEGGPTGAAAYIFHRETDGGDIWSLVKRIPELGGFMFLQTIDISGDTLVLAGGEAFAGSYIRVFERNLGGSNAWGQSKSHLEVFTSGFTARISGDYIIAANAFGVRTVRIFARNQGGLNAWGIVSELEPVPGGQALNQVRVSVSGDTASLRWFWAGPQPPPHNGVPQVLVSDVDGDGIRDARDPCPRDPFNNVEGGCQRASGLYAVVNDSLTLEEVTTETRGAEFVITATFRNTSAIGLRDPFFEVTDLSGGNVLTNAEGSGGVGATLSPDVGDGVLSSGEPVTVTFRVALASFDPFSFLLDVRGTPVP